MPVMKTGKRFHGFQTLVRNPDLYDGDVVVENVSLGESALRLTVRNNVFGHAIPAGGPTRVLALEVRVQDANGEELDRVTELFSMKAKLFPLVGILPAELDRDTRLGAGESRVVVLDLREDLRDTAVTASVTLRFYEVPEQERGDIEKARWTSAPIFEKTVSLGARR